jgi:hypothetical protein
MERGGEKIESWLFLTYSLYVLQVEDDGELGWAGRPSWAELAQLGRFPFFLFFFSIFCFQSDLKHTQNMS